MTTSIRKLALLLCALVLAGPAAAAALPDYYPAQFDRTGVIDNVDLDNGAIAVDDVTVRIARDLRVYTPHTRFATARSLQPGMKIGFGTTGSRALGNAVSEIWVLPADFVSSRGAESPSHERRKDRD